MFMHLQRLRQEHAWLEQRIREERARPMPDFLQLQKLKRRKLAIKERLVGASGGSGSTAA